MKKVLKNIYKDKRLFHYKKGIKIIGRNDFMTGDCSYLTGDCTNLAGYCSGLAGDLDDAKITDEERKKIIDIKDLII